LRRSTACGSLVRSGNGAHCAVVRDFDTGYNLIMMSGGIIAIGAIVAGHCLKLCVEQRRFYRRNAMGVEEFPSYASVVLTRTLERFVVLLSRVLVIGGIAWVLVKWTPGESGRAVASALRSTWAKGAMEKSEEPQMADRQRRPR